MKVEDLKWLIEQGNCYKIADIDYLYKQLLKDRGDADALKRNWSYIPEITAKIGWIRKHAKELGWSVAPKSRYKHEPYVIADPNSTFERVDNRRQAALNGLSALERGQARQCKNVADSLEFLSSQEILERYTYLFESASLQNRAFANTIEMLVERIRSVL